MKTMVLKYVSMAYLEEISGGDLDFQREILDTFLMEIPIDLEKIKMALEKEDWESLAQSVHKIKAPVEMFCDTEVNTLIQGIEQQAKNQEKADLSLKTKQMLKILDQVLLEMQEIEL